MLKRWSL